MKDSLLDSTLYGQQDRGDGSALHGKKGLPGLAGRASAGDYQQKLHVAKNADVNNYTFAKYGQSAGPGSIPMPGKMRMYDSEPYAHGKGQLGAEHVSDYEL